MQILRRRCRYIPNRDIHSFATQPSDNVIVKIHFEECQIASCHKRQVKTQENTSNETTDQRFTDATGQ